MIHETSIIEKGAKIADDVEIGPFCFIGCDVELKQGCKLESNVILKGKLKVGKNARIFSFAAIGNENSNITIGKKTQIREFCQIGSPTTEEDQRKITIGENNFIMAYVQMSQGVETGEFCIITNAVRIYEDVKCEERCVIGGMSSIEAGNKIGTGVMIGGASCINQDIPPYTLVEGNKAEIKGLNVVGLRRRLENKDDIEEIKSIFKKILNKNVDKELAKEIAKTHENNYVKRFAEFVADSNL
jgi:UDP-N-acetylglucosamine acyltransferase